MENPTAAKKTCFDNEQGAKIPGLRRDMTMMSRGGLSGLVNLPVLPLGALAVSDIAKL
jgi:hypothetical protein